MQPLSVDDLPAHDDWPARLLGLTEQAPHHWGGTGVASYAETHRQLLDQHRDHPDWNADDLARAASWHVRDDPAPVSRGGDLFLAGPDETQDLQNEVLLDAIDPVLDGGETVVALGCGFGLELHLVADAYPGCTVVGGEPSEPGRTLARRLLPDEITVTDVDLRDDEWPLLAEAPGDDVVVVTRGSLTALQSARGAVDTLERYADRVTAGVHLEHVHEMHPRDTTLGLLRRAYGRERGYDRDLLPALEADDRLALTGRAYDCVGGNPLHPVSTLRWQPAEGTV